MLSINELINLLKSDSIESHKEYLKNLDKYKLIIDKTPNKFLKHHLDNCLEKEQYELAEYIKLTAENRFFLLK